jgi:hypothetical protein
MSIRKAQPNLSCLGAFGQAIWNPSQRKKGNVVASNSSEVRSWHYYLNIRRWFGQAPAQNSNNNESSCVIEFSRGQSVLDENTHPVDKKEILDTESDKGADLSSQVHHLPDNSSQEMQEQVKG